MTTFDHDPVVQRPEPDREILARAHNYMLRTETEMDRYLRQQWEATLGAVRVAIDSWRKVWPLDIEQLSTEEIELARDAAEELESAYHSLDRLSRRMLGEIMHYAQQGKMTPQWLDEVGA